jgi:hypothetical protein
MIDIFDPPIQLNRERLPELPTTIATPGEARTVLHMLPTYGIQWCGVVACLETLTDMMMLRLALATALERYGFLSPNDVDACGRGQH